MNSLQLLTESEKTQLLKNSSSRDLNAGELLFDFGEPASCCYLLMRGHLSLFRRQANGNNKLYRDVFPGALVAEMVTFMSDGYYPMSAKANQSSIVTVVEYQKLRTIVEQRPLLAGQFLQYQADHIRELMDNTDILTEINAAHRLLRRLAGFQRHPGSAFRIPITKQLLASQLSMAPETLSRLLSKLRKQNLLSSEGQHWYLASAKSICNHYELDPTLFSTTPGESLR